MEVGTVWEAVGAVGTWVIGFGAIFIGFKANTLSRDLRAAETRRADRSARAVASSLRVSIHAYLEHARWFAGTLRSLAENGSPTMAKQALLLYESASQARLPDISALSIALPSLPDDLAARIARLSAVESNQIANMRSHVNYLREHLTPSAVEVAAFKNYFLADAEAYEAVATKVATILEALERAEKGATQAESDAAPK
jgi:hypothetical protein